MKTTKKMIEVMQAFEDGKEIEYRDYLQQEWNPILFGVDLSEAET